MRILIGQAHRERILKFITPGTRVLEWGSGGSTLWFADRLPIGATLTSIDHDAGWHAITRSRVGERLNVQMLLCPPDSPLGKNATIEEEDPSKLDEYIHAADGKEFDVIIVDGVARVACMERARHLLGRGGVVFLHDAHRPWYDSGKAFYIEHGTVGSCPEYPGPILWWGGLEPEKPRYSRGALPIVINCYTRGTPYEQEVQGLRFSLEQLGMEAEIVGVPNLGSWERNCAFKAQFIHDTYFKLDRPVLWLDADARVRNIPGLLAGADPDFGVAKVSGWQIASGTVYFNRTPLGERVLTTWLEYCRRAPTIWDQIHLDRAWEEVTANHSLFTRWLPQPYVKIFDMPWESRLTIPEHGEDPIVIEHLQASRRLKNKLGAKKTVAAMRHPSEELINARKACRPRTTWYDECFVLREHQPAPDLWAVPPKMRFFLR